MAIFFTVLDAIAVFLGVSATITLCRKVAARRKILNSKAPVISQIPPPITTGVISQVVGALFAFVMLTLEAARYYWSWGLDQGLDYVIEVNGSGFCIPVYPLPLSIALLIGNTALSSLLIYKFVTVLLFQAREWRRVVDDELSAELIRIANFAKGVATRNLIFSTTALMFSDMTMVALTTLDIMMSDDRSRLVMSVVDLIGSID
ncbi:hypothetical protein HK405_005991, partial [Cladochytrium tenue]